MFQQLCVMKLLKEKQKQLQQILMKKMQSVKQKISLFTCLFINYQCIVDNCQYLLLTDNILSKTKTLNSILHHKKKFCVNMWIKRN